MIISTGTNRKSTNWLPQDTSWEELVARMREPIRTKETMQEYATMTRDEKANAKDVGGFVGGKVIGGNRKAGSITDRQLVCLDADYADTDLWDAWELMVGYQALMHSTHSHTPSAPRLRFIIPLSRPVSAAEYEPIARYLASQMDIEAFDDTTYEPSRLMYWPSCPSDGEYLFKTLDAPVCDADAVLSTFADWHDMRNWPHSSRREITVIKRAEKQGNPLDKPGLIGAFNRAHTITDAIETYLPDVYDACADGRWTYKNGSTVGGGVSYDNDTFLYSHHDTDPACGKLLNAFDLVRTHLFGEQDEGYDGEIAQSPSQLAMKALCVKDDAVRAELAASLVTDLPEGFSNEDAGNISRLKNFVDDPTEQGAARKFVYMYGSNLRYNASFGWLFWDSQKWEVNAEAEAKMLMMCYTDSVYAEAEEALKTAGENKEAKSRAMAALKRANRMRTASGINGMMNLTKAIVNDPDANSYDARAWDLNTPAGIVDLKTGRVRLHNRDAKATKITSVSVDSEQGVDEWQRFVDHITAGDNDFARYLQTLAGMAAVGEVYEEGLVISQGNGGNGKSTFFGALRRVLGDYARTINADVLIATNGKTDQSYTAAMRGARLVIMSETEEGAKLSVSQMKRLTSRDTISARALYKDPIEFEPTHTVIMHTNHLPKLKSLDGGTRRRIAVAPFPATLPPERVITNYERVLFDHCAGAILSWIVDGARMFYATDCKLVKPEVVRQATAKYMEGEDWLKAFLEECCETAPGYSVMSGALREKYHAYCLSTKEFERDAKDFARAMEEKGFEKKRGNRGILWMGVRIIADDEGAPF